MAGGAPAGDPMEVEKVLDDTENDSDTATARAMLLRASLLARALGGSLSRRPRPRSFRSMRRSTINCVRQQLCFKEREIFIDNVMVQIHLIISRPCARGV